MMHFEIWGKVVQYRINGSGEVKREVRRYWLDALWDGREESMIGAYSRLLPMDETRVLNFV